MNVSAQAQTLGFHITGKLTPTEGQEPCRRRLYFKDEAGNVYVVRRGILTIIAADGKIY